MSYIYIYIEREIYVYTHIYIIIEGGPRAPTASSSISAAAAPASEPTSRRQRRPQCTWENNDNYAGSQCTYIVDNNNACRNVPKS